LFFQLQNQNRIKKYPGKKIEPKSSGVGGLRAERAFRRAAVFQLPAIFRPRLVFKREKAGSTDDGIKAIARRRGALARRATGY
jgi:hypothetical protein